MKKTSVKVLLFALLLTSLASVSAYAEEYKFKVTNSTKTVITKILVSEDGEKYGFFDIGKGIKPGQTVELVWDKSTNNEACKQHVKAVYADGSESEPAMFDFCESDVALEFND
ncbi:MAG TPA: hypothetical protein VHX14_01700 [Thermoanaerobaculia bacterium]|jgi:hypothetical protein|nr:hypothetical protein [Thermoanaerobaculia bacterium]